jgi:leucyl aminopeptidase (aminopeptidase T)
LATSNKRLGILRAHDADNVSGLDPGAVPETVVDHHLAVALEDPVRWRIGHSREPSLADIGQIKRDDRFEKVKAGTLSWSGCLYGTQALAAEAGMTLEEYWDQIIYACYLDDLDPVSGWRATAAEIKQTVAWLNGLDIDRLHVEADGTDLWVKIGEQRRWAGGGSVNVPSFEIATSPDWRGIDGHIAFSVAHDVGEAAFERVLTLGAPTPA